MQLPQLVWTDDSMKLTAPCKVDLSHLRGMGEPLYFAFNVLKESKALLCHAVIFSSFVVPDDDTKIKICAPEDDPRMPQFIEFVIENYGKKARESLTSEIKQRSAELNELQQQIYRAKRELKQAKRKEE